MINETITAGLRPYSIGEKVRGLRQKKGMGWWNYGNTPDSRQRFYRSWKGENSFPTLPTLLRIALVFSVGLDFFFTDKRKRRIVAVVRAKDHVRFPERAGISDVSYFFECLDYPATEKKTERISCPLPGTSVREKPGPITILESNSCTFLVAPCT